MSRTTDDGCVAVLTGAAGGLGSRLTLGLLGAGRCVVAVELPEADERLRALERAAAEAGGAERLVVVRGDLRDEATARRALETAQSRFGGVDALINNAGLGMNAIMPRSMTAPLPFYEIPAERWRALIEVNVTAPFLLARAIVPALLAGGWGRVINVTTGYPTMVKRGFSPYGPSKAALEAATAIWSEELAGTGVTVNALLPGGAADTPMVTTDDVADRTTLVRPEAMIAPALWLTSAASNGVNGCRVVARLWDPAAETGENVQRAVAPAAWRSGPSGS